MNETLLDRISQRLDRLEIIAVIFGITLVALAVLTAVEFVLRRRPIGKVVIRDRKGNSRIQLGKGKEDEPSLVSPDVSNARNSDPPVTLGMNTTQRHEVARCVDASPARSPSTRLTCRHSGGSPGASHCPGSRSAEPASSWATHGAYGRARSPSRCSATRRRSGGPAVATRRTG